ncbi:NUDIX domain-containing protein [Aneurinibacillus uraniidurans]|uniref:NUDIX domain-containing protein n=1 Tax=Aneurinibacillus uraniidurans TaxID=2966586 RepID=UPI002349809C|nr:NUDIX hydrolase [Aneurinibacillus sp. B1]WCN36865.1 NUDIX hydrolase [Aneurinibacillus sp. B1]
MNEKTVSSQTIYEGKVITLKVDEVELPNGKTASREIVTHPGAVAVMAITDDNRLVVVRQFRKPLERTIVEIPAGKLEPGEEPVVCAHRELEEETGYTTQTMQHVASCYTSPGFANEIIHLYRTNGLIAGEAKPDEDEFVELMHITIEEAQQLIAAGEICDAKTIMAVYAWQIETHA